MNKRLTVFFKGPYYMGCYTESSNRELSSKVAYLYRYLPAPYHAMTIETCINACGCEGHLYAGLQNG